jgi:cytidylate kinase
MVIAVDGPAGAGKSTVARAVADALGMIYLDSGAMYRGIALAALRAGMDPGNAEAVARLAREVKLRVDGDRIELDGADVSAEIRTPEVTDAASRVAAHPGVREAMVERQRAMIDNGRYVAEGRDIGTVVSPDAPLKVFLTASDAERARRRAGESGQPVERVLAEQDRRDARDAEREHSPLRVAADAVELDTTSLSIDDVVDRVVRLARERGLA